MGMRFFNVTFGFSLLFLVMAAESYETPWPSEDFDDQDTREVLVPIAFIPLPLAYNHMLRTSSSHALKRNSEILNTLLGSGALNNMKNNGRRR
ncbi:uncharacterized protein LOC135204180 [Macrobrachium nipponense]|uniref:uncharacterized protein LOC135204180 n=1 Tax=Macrobrachium nipponense TaxID=159736 RepID=UPI0030C7F8B1